MIKALSVSLKTNLMSLSKHLWQRGIAHKITEERGQQIIWVAEENDAQLVKHYFNQWNADTTPNVEHQDTTSQNNAFINPKRNNTFSAMFSLAKKMASNTCDSQHRVD